MSKCGITVSVTGVIIRGTGSAPTFCGAHAKLAVILGLRAPAELMSRSRFRLPNTRAGCTLLCYYISVALRRGSWSASEADVTRLQCVRGRRRHRPSKQKRALIQASQSELIKLPPRSSCGGRPQQLEPSPSARRHGRRPLYGQWVVSGSSIGLLMGRPRWWAKRWKRSSGSARTLGVAAVVALVVPLCFVASSSRLPGTLGGGALASGSVVS